VYPKQKSITACHRSCGDFLVLPLGMDQEKARLSEFVDPGTFEAVESVVVTEVVRFREASAAKTMIPPDESNSEGSMDREVAAKS
jgi:hypothetical protein